MSVSGSESTEMASPEPRRRSSMLSDADPGDDEHVMSVDDYQRHFRELIHGQEPLCYAVVKYDYIGVNADELSLRQGESVAIYIQDEAEIGDVGWWFGMFPAPLRDDRSNSAVTIALILDGSDYAVYDSFSIVSHSCVVAQWLLHF